MIDTEQTPEVAPPPGLMSDDASSAVFYCYLSSLQAMAECIVAACPPVGAQYCDQLMRVRRRVAYDHTAQSLEEARQSLENTLASYADQAYRYSELRGEDLRQILETLDKIEESSRDGGESIPELAEEIRQRLRAGQQLATLDPLTGLANRRELERQVKLRLVSDKQFCVLFFDIDDFGLLNESLGRETGDAILKQAAERLNTQIRARDVAARWLADEFIVIIECDMENARERSRQMSQHLCGPYKVVEEGREVELGIRVSSAVAECHAGDTPRQLWLRLEEDFEAQNTAAA